MREELLNEIREDVVAQLMQRAPWISLDELASEALSLTNWGRV